MPGVTDVNLEEAQKGYAFVLDAMYEIAAATHQQLFGDPNEGSEVMEYLLLAQVKLAKANKHFFDSCIGLPDGYRDLVRL